MSQAFLDIRSKYADTVQAGQAGLIFAKLEIDKNNIDGAKTALDWVAKNASDDGYKLLAQLRLASILMEKKSYDIALQEIPLKYPAEFESIVTDRKGDILLLQDKKYESIAEYKKSHIVSGDNSEYQQLISVKLSALGVQSRNTDELKMTKK